MDKILHGAAFATPEPLRIDLRTGALGLDPRVERASKTLGQMADIFLDEEARTRMDATTVVYVVEYWKPVGEGTEGGLYWGNSTVFPGAVGDEYFMTRGHFHALRNRAEYYSTVAGAGRLVLMDDERRSCVQVMEAGTTHYIPGNVAHRVVNTGSVPLTFLACWPSDAGYDYSTIEREGFSVRIMRGGSGPVVVPQ